MTSKMKDDLKNEDNLKNEDDQKNEDDLKNEDDPTSFRHNVLYGRQNPSRKSQNTPVMEHFYLNCHMIWQYPNMKQLLSTYFDKGPGHPA